MPKDLKCSYFISVVLGAVGVLGCQTKAPANVDFPFVVDHAVTVSDLRWKSIPQVAPDQVNAVLARYRVQVIALLEPDIDPYRGPVEIPQECQVQNLPSVITRQRGDDKAQILSFYSSPELLLGKCSTAGKLKTQYVILYCVREKTIFTVQYFYSDLKEWLSEAVVNCR